MVDYLSSRLNGLRGQTYREIKGSIGEEACPGILSAADWRELKRHPFGGEGEGCHQRGPDSLMSHAKVQGPQLFEYKWWKNPVEAMYVAEAGLNKFIKNNHTVLRDLGIGGGYIACLDWNPRKTVGALRMKKVWSSEWN